VAKHGDQGIDTKAVDFSADKVADPWLGYSEGMSRPLLKLGGGSVEILRDVLH